MHADDGEPGRRGGEPGGPGELGSDRPYPALARVVELLGQGEMMRALDELDSLLDSDDADLRPRAVLLLARINEARGETEQMLRAYQVAAASGHPDVAPFAAVVLGGKLLELGRLGPARRLFRQATDAADPEVRDAARSALDAMPRPWPRWRLPRRR